MLSKSKANRIHGSRWPEQERLGRVPALQHVGLSVAEITLDGVIYPGVFGGMREDTGHSLPPIQQPPHSLKPALHLQ
jgi:phage protein U